MQGGLLVQGKVCVLVFIHMQGWVGTFLNCCSANITINGRSTQSDLHYREHLSMLKASPTRNMMMEATVNRRGKDVSVFQQCMWMDGNRDSRGHARYPAVGASSLTYCQDGEHDVIHRADYRRVK